MKTPLCPCGSGRPLSKCCAPLHAGVPAPDAEALMRSRYSAWVLGEMDYLRATWHADTCPPDLASDAGEVRWLGLSVKRHVLTGEDSAEVEFVARYRVAGRGARMHEVSRFVCEDGRWLYVDGDVRG